MTLLVTIALMLIFWCGKILDVPAWYCYYSALGGISIGIAIGLHMVREVANMYDDVIFKRRRN